MGTELTEEEVDGFLMENPRFVRSWLAEHDLGKLGEHLFFKHEIREEKAHAFIDFIGNALSRRKPTQKEENETLTENELYKEVGKILNSELHTDSLCHRVLQKLCTLLRCEKASLFLARGAGKTQYLISTLFDVTSESTLEESLHTEENAIRVPFGKGISGYVAQSKCLLNIKDAYQDPRFLSDVDEKTGFRTKSILCMPILDSGDNLLAVAQVMNKINEEYFNSEDENIFERFLSFCSISMNNSAFFENSLEEHERHKLLLKLNRCILKYQNSLKKLMSEITKLAMEMLQCESISIYLSDPKKDNLCPTESSKVFQLLKSASDISEEIITPNVRKAIERNMNSQNILDVFNSEEFTEHDSIHLESKVASWLLCLAIKDASNNFVGWIVYIRDSRDIFSRNDINMMEIFAMFCGLAIYNCRLYETAAKTLSQLEFTNSVLSYHATCYPEIVDRFLNMEIESVNNSQIYRFDFNDFLYSEDDTVLVAVSIFLEAKTLSVLNISKELLYKWILTVKKNYRPVIYHNWRHAINVTQMMFCMLTTGKLQIYFTEFDRICLLVASLCHDLDHRGYNNSFQVKTRSPLALLYSTSVMEYHHISRCLMILKYEGTNIFRNISVEKYQQGLMFIEKAILATDLLMYFEKRYLFKQKIEIDDQTLSSQESIDLLMCMMMTAADLSAITKPWDIQRKTAIILAAEFFEQGDLESHFTYNVMPMMDRKKRHQLPKTQVGFIDFVCSMVYRLLSQVSKELQPLYDGMLGNRTHWSDIVEGKEEFDIDREIELVINNISLESAIAIANKQSQQTLRSLDVVEEGGEEEQKQEEEEEERKQEEEQQQQQGEEETTILTEKRATFGQKDIQTDITIPTYIDQQHILSSFTTKTVETKTTASQTENLLQDVCSAMVQTDDSSLKEAKHVTVLLPHENLVLTLGASGSKFITLQKGTLPRISHCGYHYHHYSERGLPTTPTSGGNDQNRQY
ncbi:cGMP-specific 3',5'-cyclic phosphodiesterase-like [Octopus bimaculoides]|uniref:Phosphodiesterase n=1 Tax=Octopus bimaculoides TaxID=37653 RepID=A0A0L8IDG1_OCTBM|nr:cGMP-specific 3',5'-cyclic phosphodiesterase-like [Octopus bimaculoides]|eukprot:XP_014774789.1 PREDICTED: cGMP-specific 3',5'-cyclic phosphodiesterase-like [Octopus bimaculoides]